MMEIIPQVQAAMNQHGLVPTEEIIADGELHRFHIEGDNPAKKNGWAIITAGIIPTAFYGSWKTGLKHFWQSNKPVTAEEKEAACIEQEKLREQYKAALEKKHTQAAETARVLLEESKPAETNHPYLVAKQIQPYGARQVQGILLIPMYAGDELTSLQAIYADGSKIFLKGGRVKGCHFRINDWSEEIIICEGFATGCSLEQATGCTVIVAFNASNLLPVAKYVRAKRPDAKITIAADNDIDTEGNPGLTAGRKAANSINAYLMYPDFSGDNFTGTDYNDFINAGGEL